MPLMENVASVMITLDDGRVAEFRPGEFTVRKVTTIHQDGPRAGEQFKYYEIICQVNPTVIEGAK